MSGTQTAVYGIFYDAPLAARAVERILAAGFPEENVSLLAPENSGFKDLSHTRHAAAGGSTSVVTASVAAGGVAGLLLGLSVVAIPGIGPLLAAGPILGALAGFGAGGIVGGSIDALDATGLPELGAKRYEGHIREGGILLAIHCHSESESAAAKSLLDQASAQAITES